MKKIYCCIDCGDKISYPTAIYGKGKCKSCCKLGKNNPNWRNGQSKIPYRYTFNKFLKIKIRTRDNFQCQNPNCKVKEINQSRALDIHHIDYNKMNCKETNLITLCKICNIKANFNRDYWYAFYKSLIKEI